MPVEPRNRGAAEMGVVEDEILWEEEN